MIMIDESLSGAEQAVLETQGPRPELLPWFAGAEIARFASRLGIAPVAPPMQGRALVGGVTELFRSLWEFLRWLNSQPEYRPTIVRA